MVKLLLVIIFAYYCSSSSHPRTTATAFQQTAIITGVAPRRHQHPTTTMATISSPTRRHSSSFSSIQQHHQHARPRSPLVLRMEQGESAASPQEEDPGDAATEEHCDFQHKPLSWNRRLRNYFKGPDDGLTFKQRLAKMGLAVALSYGWVSNMSYSVSVSVAWYIFSKRVRWRVALC